LSIHRVPPPAAASEEPKNKNFAWIGAPFARKVRSDLIGSVSDLSVMKFLAGSSRAEWFTRKSPIKSRSDPIGHSPSFNPARTIGRKSLFLSIHRVPPPAAASEEQKNKNFAWIGAPFGRKVRSDLIGSVSDFSVMKFLAGSSRAEWFTRKSPIKSDQIRSGILRLSIQLAPSGERFSFLVYPSRPAACRRE
jgi:hypothetical protein